METNQSSLLGLEGDYLRVRLHNHTHICTVVTYVYRKAIFVLCQVWASFNYKWKANSVLRQELILLCPTLSQMFFFPPQEKKTHWKPYCCLDWLPFIILKYTWMMTFFVPWLHQAKIIGSASHIKQPKADRCEDEEIIIWICLPLSLEVVMKRQRAVMEKPKEYSIKIDN